MTSQEFPFNKTCLAAAISLLLTLGGCSSSNNSDTNVDGEGSTTTDPAEPAFDASLFSNNSSAINNRFLPLLPGVTRIYEGPNDEGETERVEVSVSHKTIVVDGVNSAIVVVREYVDNELEEESFNWYAQDTSGNLWHLGEATTEYDDEEAVSTEGSWESGMDVAGTGINAKATIVMKNTLVAGDKYTLEDYPGVASETAEVISLDILQTLTSGDTYNSLQIQETDLLDTDSNTEYKYYAADIGLISEENVDGSERAELVASLDQKTPDIAADDFSNPTLINNPYFPLHVGDTRSYEVFEEGELSETIEIEILSPDEPGGNKIVNGIQVVVQRDRVRDEDGLIIEDTYDWFAQDDDGNVWYLGEDVTNYNYDDEGGFVDTDSGGSFEWGVDGAQPGLLMPAKPRVGDSYRQEYLAGEAEDVGAILATEVELTVSGNDYTTLKTEDWNPLEPGDVENKYYAPGIGVVREEKVDGSEYVVLVDRSVVLPDIDSATFTNPRIIDNSYFPLNIDETREYEVFEDGELIETISIEILNTSEANGDKTVNGIPVVVQRDRVRDEDGNIIEDTYDWFAQDDDGNVWYFGESVTNYHYDDEGSLTETDGGGSFEWGIDGALPGLQMPADPEVGDVYYQEFYEGEAEDMASILETDVNITVNGMNYTTIKTLDWNPLDAESAFEYKYYAPGVGTVREETIDGEETVNLISINQ